MPKTPIRPWSVRRRPGVVVEVAVDSAEDAARAEAAGADRLELNAALVVGGLTPSIGLVEAVCASADVPVVAMIRPRPGGFDYNAGELDAMVRDIARMRPLGVVGFVCGVLDADGRVDRDRNALLIDAISPATAVFHRAFDVVPDPFDALETLIELGFRRVLTSGQATAAPAGAALLRQLRLGAAGRIEILPGAGVRPENVVDLVAATGCDQIHGSFRTGRVDTSTRARPAICFGTDGSVDRGSIGTTDGSAIAAAIAVLARAGLR